MMFLITIYKKTCLENDLPINSVIKKLLQMHREYSHYLMTRASVRSHLFSLGSDVSRYVQLIDVHAAFILLVTYKTYYCKSPVKPTTVTVLITLSCQ